MGGPISGAVNVFDQIRHIFRVGERTASTQKSCVLHQRNKSKWTKKPQIVDKLTSQFRTESQKSKKFLLNICELFSVGGAYSSLGVARSI